MAPARTAKQAAGAAAEDAACAHLLAAGCQLLARNAGFRVGEVRTNDYEFISERALQACSTYGVESISLQATLT